MQGSDCRGLRATSIPVVNALAVQKLREGAVENPNYTAGNQVRIIQAENGVRWRVRLKNIAKVIPSTT